MWTWLPLEQSCFSFPWLSVYVYCCEYACDLSSQISRHFQSLKCETELLCLCSQVPGVWVIVKFNFFSIQLDHRGIFALISKLLFSYVFTQPIMVEFALHCGAYPLCQVCVGNPAHQLLGEKSSQLAALSETWRCLFSTEILGCELVHRKAQVLQL